MCCICMKLTTNVNRPIHVLFVKVFSERSRSRSRSLYAIARPSVRLSVVCLSVTLVHPTQAVEIFGNISTAFGTLAIH